MSTQGHIIIRNNRENYGFMFWINHDAFPDVVCPKIKRALKTVEEEDGPEEIFEAIKQELECENMSNFFTVEFTIIQPMNYIYWVEMNDNAIFLRTQEEYWIEQSETFDKIPDWYLNTEMRTIDVEQVI